MKKKHENDAIIMHQDLLSPEVLNELKGGVADAGKPDEKGVEAGDGAKYVCCIFS